MFLIILLMPFHFCHVQMTFYLEGFLRLDVETFPMKRLGLLYSHLKFHSQMLLQSFPKSAIRSGNCFELPPREKAFGLLGTAPEVHQMASWLRERDWSVDLNFVFVDTPDGYTQPTFPSSQSMDKEMHHPFCPIFSDSQKPLVCCSFPWIAGKR